MEMEHEMSCCQRFKISLSKLLYECFGTFLFAMLYITGANFPLTIGLWIITIFTYKVSGAQLNPAITFAYVLRKDPDARHMGIPLGLMYMGAQTAGAYAGALTMDFFGWGLAAIAPMDATEIFPAMLQESLGAFVLVMFYMMQTDEKMHFSREPAINCFIISSSYIAARTMFNGAGAAVTNYGACLNPAIAFGITFASIFNTGASALTYFWIYPVLPFAGSLCAFLFYEFVYKKTQQMLRASHAEDDLEKAEREEAEDDVLDA